MREIRFRGKRTDNDKWVYGYYCKVEGKHYIVSEYAIIQDGKIIGKVEVDPETVGQFVCQDKHGKDVFKGDVVNHFDHIRPEGTFEIAWDVNKMGWSLLGIGKTESMWLRDWSKDFVTVIGNIHNDPELLK